MKILVISLGLLSIPLLVLAQQIVPVVAHTNGAYGSVWRSDLKLGNESTNVVHGQLIFTPLNQCASDDDVAIDFSIQPWEVKYYEDLYALAYPDSSGSARVLIKIKPSSTPPAQPYEPLLVDTLTYNSLSDGGRFGQSPTIFLDRDYSYLYSSYGAILNAESERSNIYVMTGPDGATILWNYAPGAPEGGKTIEYCANMSYVHVAGPIDIFGYDPGPNTMIYAIVFAGEARFAASIIDNRSNDGRWIEFQKEGPE